MKSALSYAAAIIGLAIGLFAPTALADTTAVGPYYANPSWDQQLPASTRFIVLSNWGGAAVLDRETGLVWEKSPSTLPSNWSNAQFHCISLNAGGRTGWHLPTIQELMSLVDRSVSPGPTLPVGHPFTTVQPSFYWTATAKAAVQLPNFAWVVAFVDGSAFEQDKTVAYLVWCARGGQSVDSQ